jgi:hypothetical protein
VHITRDIKLLNRTCFKRNEIVTINNGINFNMVKNLEIENLKNIKDIDSNEISEELVRDTEDNTTDQSNVMKKEANKVTIITRSGRIVKMPAKYNEFAKIGIYDCNKEVLKMEFIGFTEIKQLKKNIIEWLNLKFGL